MKTTQTQKQTLKELVSKYDHVALALQGGGALGSYQAGVYEGLCDLDIEPTRIVGTSIGALNSAIIAGNTPKNRVKALKDFWNTICKTNMSPYDFGLNHDWINSLSLDIRKFFSATSATRSMIEGQNGFFKPKMPNLNPFRIQNPNEISYYNIDNLKETLNKFVDFDLINSKKIHLSVGAVNIRTGQLHYFDNLKTVLRAEHFIASGALPPGFPAVEIDGEYYWDGGIVSNTPLEHILTDKERNNTLVFQVDLWSSYGDTPKNMSDVSERVKDIQYSSRTRLITHIMSEEQKNKRILQELLKKIPEEIKENDHWCKVATKQSEHTKMNIIQLIYRDKHFEGHYKDYEFSSPTMSEHWSSGLNDIHETMKNQNWLLMPSDEKGFVTHDIHRNTSTSAKAKSAFSLREINSKEEIQSFKTIDEITVV
jgi:NTE family protein